MDILERVLRGSGPESFERLDDFWRRHLEVAGDVPQPIDRAVLGGALADRLGFAFVAGYSAAIQALFGRPSSIRASLAATEAGGAHPRAIETTLTRAGDRWRLDGHKRWVSAPGEELFVLCRRADTPGPRAQLLVVRVPTERVRLIPQPPMSFIPEVSHAELALENVEVFDSEVLEGDGWERWVKPFRTVEDLHVHAALLGHLLSVGTREAWPEDALEALAHSLTGFVALTHAPPDSPSTHVSLAGAFAALERLLDRLSPQLDRLPPPERDRWRRDAPLLAVAGKARALRRAKAWERLRAGHP